MSTYRIEIGHSPAFATRDGTVQPLAWATVTGPAGRLDMAIPAGGMGRQQALWQAMRRAFERVPSGASVLLAAEERDLPLARHLVRLMLGDEPRIRITVAALPGRGDARPAPSHPAAVPA
jgi:hypothetical protein